MRHIRTYNEAAQSPDFRKVNLEQIERRMKGMVYDYFSPAEVNEVIGKAAELGWKGKVTEWRFRPVKGNPGFSISAVMRGMVYGGSSLRVTGLPSGTRSEANYPRMQSNKLLLVLDELIDFFEILKSVDDYFYVEAIGNFPDSEYKFTYYVCEGIDGVLSLMEWVTDQIRGAGPHETGA